MVTSSMAGSTAKGKRPRRTQEERRAATRAALLDATIECLVDYGYAGVTTTRVVERAGVSRGAQVHHFPTKAMLVSEAVTHLIERVYTDIAAQLSNAPTGARRFDLVLDLAWSIHTGPLFKAGLELWVAARTDDELRAHVVEVQEQVIGSVQGAVSEFLPEHARRAEFRGAVDTALATIRGLAMVSAVMDGDGEVEALWKDARKRLKRMLVEASGGSTKNGRSRAA